MHIDEIKGDITDHVRMLTAHAGEDTILSSWLKDAGLNHLFSRFFVMRYCKPFVQIKTFNQTCILHMHKPLKCSQIENLNWASFLFYF